MRPTGNDAIDDPCEYMAQLAQRILPLEKWGFKEITRLPREILYGSDLCKFTILWEDWDYMGGYSINIYYGRLHASNEAAAMQWNGDECKCWHRAENVIHFLDFLDGQKLPDKIPIGWLSSHPVDDEFRQSEVGKSMTGKRRQTEWLMRMESAIWERYAPRLFEVFDLRRPELWEQYREFLRACYVAEGRSEEIDEKKWKMLPYYRVC